MGCMSGYVIGICGCQPSISSTNVPASEVPMRCANTSTMIFARYLEAGGMRVHNDSLTGLDNVWVGHR